MNDPTIHTHTAPSSSSSNKSNNNKSNNSAIRSPSPNSSSRVETHNHNNNNRQHHHQWILGFFLGCTLMPLWWALQVEYRLSRQQAQSVRALDQLSALPTHHYYSYHSNHYHPQQQLLERLHLQHFPQATATATVKATIKTNTTTTNNNTNNSRIHPTETVASATSTNSTTTTAAAAVVTGTTMNDTNVVATPPEFGWTHSSRPKHDNTNNHNHNNNTDTTTAQDAAVQAVVQELDTLVQQQTPAARFVRLLQTHLHWSPTAENGRIRACRKLGLMARCFSGRLRHDEQKAYLPLDNNKNNIHNNTVRTVHDMRRFGPQQHEIIALGTETVCLPLLLAGAAVVDDDDNNAADDDGQNANANSIHNGVIVELGPFVGLSSRCLGWGLAAAAPSTPDNSRLYAFDTWNNQRNFKAITRGKPWIQAEHPGFTEDNNDFLWLWKMVMEDVYPDATAVQGRISATTLHRGVWQNRSVAVLSIDSIKDWFSWKSQLAGLAYLEAGSILCVLDFEFTDQPNFVYACLRPEYLLPVYTSWHQAGHWIFVVKKTIPLQNPDLIGDCMEGLLLSDNDDAPSPSNAVLKVMRDRLQTDLIFLQNLQGIPLEPDAYLNQHAAKLLEGLSQEQFDQTSTKYWRRFQPN